MVLEVKSLRFSYQEKAVLKSISFQLQKGERLVIVGESGCGKTTLLKAIAGYLQPGKGKIVFEGERVKGPNDQLVPGNPKIKLVNQDFGLDNFHTVEENIRLRLLQFDKAYIDYRIEELLKVTGLAEYRDAVANQLSGGQKQRLSIARALADEPELLLLDEPFNQLDYFLKQKVENYIDDYLNENNITVILVSHNGEETMRWGDQVMFLKSGKIVRKDTAVNFYETPSNKKEAGFFGVINTVFYKGRNLSFRPHQFGLKKDEVNIIRLQTDFIKAINKGWYYDNLFKVGNRVVHLYTTQELTGVETVFVQPVEFT